MDNDNLEFLAHLELTFDTVTQYILCKRCGEKPLAPYGLAQHIRKYHRLDVERKDSVRLKSIGHDLPHPPLHILRQRPVNREHITSGQRTQPTSPESLVHNSQGPLNMEPHLDKRQATCYTSRPSKRSRLGGEAAAGQQRTNISEKLLALMTNKAVGVNIVKFVLPFLIQNISHGNVYIFDPLSREQLQADSERDSGDTPDLILFEYVIFPIYESDIWYAAIYCRKIGALHMFGPPHADHFLVAWIVKNYLSPAECPCDTIFQKAATSALCSQKEYSGILMLGFIKRFLRSPDSAIESMAPGKPRISYADDPVSLRKAIIKLIDPRYSILTEVSQEMFMWWKEPAASWSTESRRKDGGSASNPTETSASPINTINRD